MKQLLPILFVLIAGGIFFGYIDPAVKRIKTLQVEEARFDQALTRSRELQKTRDQLISRYNTFSPDDLLRLQRMLPDNIDNVRLILDFDALASRYGMRVRNVGIETSGTRAEQGKVGVDDSPFGILTISFSVSTSYDIFRAFLEDLERSLRLVDVKNISFTAGANDVYEYTVSVRTYWLKP